MIKTWSLFAFFLCLFFLNSHYLVSMESFFNRVGEWLLNEK